MSVDLSTPQGFDILRAHGLRYLFVDCDGIFWASPDKPVRLGKMWAFPVSSVLVEHCPFPLTAEDAPFDLASEYIWKSVDYFKSKSNERNE